jgi:hypothetical protein
MRLYMRIGIPVKLNSWQNSSLEVPRRNGILVYWMLLVDAAGIV